MSESQPQILMNSSTPKRKGPVLNPEFTLSPIGTKDNVLQKKRMPSDCPVTVSIEWADRTKRTLLPPELSAIGKMICRGTKRQIARAVWNCAEVRKHIYDEVVKQIQKECVSMCVKGSTKESKKRTAA